MTAELPDEHEQKLQAELADAEARGADSQEVAVKIEELAAFLRLKKKVLDAVNLEARAKKIRAAHYASTKGDEESSGEEEPAEKESAAGYAWRAPSRKEQTTITVIALLVLFGVSGFCRVIGDLVPAVKAFGWMFSGIAFVVLFRSAFPFDLWPVHIGVIAIWAAVTLFVPGMSLFSAGPSGVYEQGWKYMNERNYKDAFSQFNLLVTQQPNVPDFWVARAAASAGLKRYEFAIKDCYQANSIMMGNREMRNNQVQSLAALIMGISKYRTGKYEEGLKSLMEVEYIEGEIGRPDPKRKGIAAYYAALCLRKLERWEEVQEQQDIATEAGITLEPDM